MLYFVAFDSAFGTMAEQTAIDRRRAVVLADDANVPAIAAGMNPGMSSWVALRKRISFEPGQKVLVLGATGNAGQMAVQIAKFLGAGDVAAAGRDPERLARLTSLGADQIVSLAGEPDEAMRALASAGADADVVIDYLWGAVREQAIPALVESRAERGKPLSWIQIGAIAAELPELADQISSGAFVVDPVATPLSEVESAWNATTAPGQRIVFTP
jgi:NADPH:quinone reductase-like Zn-dependent oxidoreductase